jgi:predicted lipid-binding transport protein (Tim44 family)
MKKSSGLMISVLIGSALLLSGVGEAYAKRLGGGSSFGSRPSYSEPYRRSTGTNQPGMSQPAAPAQQPAYSAASQRNQAMRDSLAQRGGLMRLLGGLALGGLLGALLFGGAFEHLNIFDILVFGLIAFMLFKLFAARRASSGEQTAAPGGYSPAARDIEPERPYTRQANAGQPDRAGFNTDVLFGKNRTAAAAGTSEFAAQPAAPVLPADFDAAAFLSGAKAAYAMMQKAWDTGDLAELRALTTDKVFGELQDQLRARGGTPNWTELLKVEAEILEVRDVGPDREVAVLFDVLLRESVEESPAQVREVWHFTRFRNSRQPTWFLDGIQQIED